MAKNTVDPNDLAAFFDAMRDVTPLKHNKKPLNRPASHPRKKAVLKEERELAFHFEDDPHAEPILSDTILSFKKTNIADKILRNLKKGQYNIEARLDLHGMTIQEAEIALSHFFETCLTQKYRVVLIISGKGKNHYAPVLKNKLNQWLRQFAPVLAFCSALPRHGGTGALYVLLKHSR
jgi:DNA-nicking Smr family endonuclease